MQTNGNDGRLYRLLGLSPEATQEDIRKAHRRLVHEYHPDANPDDSSAEERFKEIQRAYDTLSDPEKRRAYDEKLQSPHVRRPWRTGATREGEASATRGAANPDNHGETARTERSRYLARIGGILGIDVSRISHETGEDITRASRRLGENLRAGTRKGSSGRRAEGNRPGAETSGKKKKGKKVKGPKARKRGRRV